MNKRILPLILGHEFCGEIVEVGEGVNSLDIGQRVLSKHLVSCGRCEDCLGDKPYACKISRLKTLGLRRNGGFAKYALVPADHSMILPEHIPYEIAVLTQPMVLAANAVNRAGLKIGDKVVVLGPGLIGLLTLVAAINDGATKELVVGLSGDGKRLEIAKTIGATQIVNADLGDSS